MNGTGTGICYSTPGTSSAVSCEVLDTAISQFNALCLGPLRRTALMLEKEINSLNIVPPRCDVFGKLHPQTFREFLLSHPFLISPDAYKRITDEKNGTTNFFSHKSSSCSSNLLKYRRKKLTRIKALNAISCGLSFPRNYLHSTEMIESCIERHWRVNGHIDRTYTVHFDRTGCFALTAADDATIKVWDVNRAFLRYTFRGHSSIISDMCISPCNQLMASGGNDKTVRVWSLKKGSTLEVFHYHTALVANLAFLPYIFGTKRWLFSFGHDCNIIFYPYDEETSEFTETPTLYNVRDANGMKCVSSTCSTSGKWIAVGDTTGYVRMFHFERDVVKRDPDIRADPTGERVDSLKWSHNGMNFISASSKSHIGRIWRRKPDGSWWFREFQPLMPAAEDVANFFTSGKIKYGVYMVCWTTDDRSVISSGTDFKIRVYDAVTGAQKHALLGHKGATYHLREHPMHSHVIISAGHEGFIMIWDTIHGRLLKKIVNDDRNSAVAVLDVDFSDDGSRIATVDDLGRLAIYGYGTHDQMGVPREQFFSTDYDVLDYDVSGYCVDSNTGLSPHLMPPPLLVNINKDIHDDKWQKMVPGKEKDLNSLECAWISRDIVPSLNQIQRQQNAKIDEAYAKIEEKALSSAPVESWENYYNTTDLDSVRTSISIQRLPSQGERTRSRRTAPTIEQVIAEQNARRAAAVMEGYNSADDDDYTDTENEEHSNSNSSHDESEVEAEDEDEEENEEESNSSDSDFSVGNSKNRREGSQSQPQQEEIVTSSGRRVHRRVFDEPSTSTSRPKPRQSKPKRRVLLSSSTEDNDEAATAPEDVTTGLDLSDPDQPGPSNRPAPQDGLPKPGRPRYSKKDAYKMTFPETMRIVRPRRFPYVAQLGDSVVYCRQGHERYIGEVERLKLYLVTPKMHPHPNLNAEEFCIVDDIRYTLKPYRLTVIKLAQLDRSGLRTGLSFTVKFHDLDNCPDFLILRHHYDEAVRHSLSEGDELEAILEGKWYTGMVIQRQAISEEYPTSNWLSLTIRWENGDEDTISPWDCQLKTNGRKSGTDAEEQDEVLLGESPPEADDWLGEDTPAANKKACCERLNAAINNLIHLETVEPFVNPVNLGQFPNYAAVVDYCIDLQTICERLTSGFYRRLQAVQHDIRMLAVAAAQFNEPHSSIVRNARCVVEALIRFSKDLSLAPDDIPSFFDTMFDMEESDFVEYQLRKPVAAADRRENGQNESENQEEAENRAWIPEVRSVIQDAMSSRWGPIFCANSDTRNEALKEALEEKGNLDTVLEELPSFQSPIEVLNRVKEILDACREAIDDTRSRECHSAQQVTRLLEEKLCPIISQFDNEHHAYGRPVAGLSLRDRKWRLRNNAYNTRSANMSALGSSNGYYRHLALGDGLPRINGVSNTRRSSRTRGMLRSGFQEETIITDLHPSPQRRSQRATRSSTATIQEEGEAPEPEAAPSRRSTTRENDYHEEEVEANHEAPNNVPSSSSSSSSDSESEQSPEKMSSDSETESEPNPKKSGRSKKATRATTSEEESEEEPRKSRRAANGKMRKKTAKHTSESSDEEEEEKRLRSKKTPKVHSRAFRAEVRNELLELQEDEDEAMSSSPRRSRRSTRTRSRKEIEMSTSSNQEEPSHNRASPARKRRRIENGERNGSRSRPRRQAALRASCVYTDLITDSEEDDTPRSKTRTTRSSRRL